MPAKDPHVCIMHIRDACRRIGEYVAGEGPDWTSKPLVIVMHAYDSLKPELIRAMAEKDVPELLVQCLRLLGEEEQ